MPCSQTLAGLAKDCLSSMGGIVEVYLANREAIDNLVLTADGEIKDIQRVEDGQFFKYEFARNTGSLSSNYTVDDTTGAKYVVSDLVLVFNRMDTDKRIEITALAQSELVAIVKDANGKYWYLGYDEPISISAGDGLTGTARGDRNGYSITLQDNSLEMPHEVLVGDSGVDLDALLEPYDPQE